MPRLRRATPAASQLGGIPKESSDLRICIYDEPRHGSKLSPKHHQPPITIVPPSDTDAYITQKVVTPFEILPDDRTVRRVLNYVVAWPDKPYARQLVPCNEILDYVSPRTLEDFEYSITLREHAAAEAAAAAKTAEKNTRMKVEEQILDEMVLDDSPKKPSVGDTGMSSARSQGPRGPGGPGKRRGRKPKAETSGVARPSETAPKEPLGDTDDVIVQNIPSAIMSGDRRTGFSLKLKRPFEQFLETAPTDSPMDSDAEAAVRDTDGGSDEQFAGSARWSSTDDHGGASGTAWRRHAEEAPTSGEDGSVGSDGPRGSSGFNATLPELHPTKATSSVRITPIPLPKVPGMPETGQHASHAGQTAHPEPNHAAEPAGEEAGEEEENDLYEVERLEGDTLYSVDDFDDPEGNTEPGSSGRFVRFFLVRWKGNWPPDQNPTWEPAENLPPKMVRQYLKASRQRAAPSSN